MIQRGARSRYSMTTLSAQALACHRAERAAELKATELRALADECQAKADALRQRQQPDGGPEGEAMASPML